MSASVSAAGDTNLKKTLLNEVFATADTTGVLKHKQPKKVENEEVKHPPLNFKAAKTLVEEKFQKLPPVLEAALRNTNSLRQGFQNVRQLTEHSPLVKTEAPALRENRKVANPPRPEVRPKTAGTPAVVETNRRNQPLILEKPATPIRSVNLETSRLSSVKSEAPKSVGPFLKEINPTPKEQTLPSVPAPTPKTVVNQPGPILKGRQLAPARIIPREPRSLATERPANADRLKVPQPTLNTTTRSRGPIHQAPLHLRPSVGLNTPLGTTIASVPTRENVRHLVPFLEHGEEQRATGSEKQTLNLFHPKVRGDGERNLLVHQAHEALMALLSLPVTITLNLKPETFQTQTLKTISLVNPGFTVLPAQPHPAERPRSIETVARPTLNRDNAAPVRSHIDTARVNSLALGGAISTPNPLGNNNPVASMSNSNDLRRLPTNQRSRFVPIGTVNLLDLTL